MKIFLVLLFLILVMTLLNVGADDSITEGNLKLIGQIEMGTGYDVAVEGAHAYVSTNDGVAIIDISRPDAPRQESTVDCGGVFGLSVQGNLLLASGAGTGLFIVDVANPASPRILSEYSEAGGAKNTCMRDSILIVCYARGGIRVLNISDPTAPTLISTWDGGGRARGAVWVDSTLYLADNQSGLEVLNLADLFSIKKSSTMPETVGTWDLMLTGDEVNVSCFDQGFRVYNVVDRDKPELVSAMALDGEIFGIWRHEKIICLANLSRGVQLIDISLPDSPKLLATAEGSKPHSVWFDGKYIYVADMKMGFVVLEYTLGSEE